MKNRIKKYKKKLDQVHISYQNYLYSKIKKNDGNQYLKKKQSKCKEVA